VLAGALCRLRAWTAADATVVQPIADDPLVARWMSRHFPSPYSRADAEAWIASVGRDDPPNHFAIDVDGTLAGGIGIVPDAWDYAGVAHIGYWLGRRFWGRGIATDAARTIARYAFETRRLRRLETSVYAPNVASARVLEKAGFTLEGRLRASITLRDGKVYDRLLYARLASDPERPSP
jgi:RimJ/RimL family protein N-acetyltransferase